MGVEIMREFTVVAPAKLNLYLDVLKKRPDGYHNIETLFEKIDLKDEIIIKETKKGVDVKVEPRLCPEGKDNIVYKAVQALFKASNMSFGLDIVIKKGIPVAAGLGGGSSDAASVLCSINDKFELGVSGEKLFSIAEDLGKDVPFFMLDVPFAIAKSAGELLEPIKVECALSHIIIKPEISASTAEMYKRFDESAGAGYKKTSLKELVSALKAGDIESLERNCYNAFEKVLGNHSSHIDEAKSLLLRATKRTCFLSGSGPSVFCTAKDRKEAIEIRQSLPTTGALDVFLATTYKGGIYGDN